MQILNLGCGTKTSNDKNIVNIDWSFYLRIKKNPILRIIAPFLMGKERRRKYTSLPSNIKTHDLTKGIPFNSNSIDAVYHSHLLEHLDRKHVTKFFYEIKRVLKVGGIHRIVVPDLEILCKKYLKHIVICNSDPNQIPRHEYYISNIIEQLIRQEAYSSRQQKPLRKMIENIVLGNAVRRGESHRWMYDRISLSELLKICGFRNTCQVNYNESLIPNWKKYGLDCDEYGKQYKNYSLYIEALK